MKMQVIVVYARWCPICNMMKPMLEEVFEDFETMLEVDWVDVDAHPEAYEQYEVEVIPTLICYCEGDEVMRMAGLIGERNLRERIKKNACISKQSNI